MSNIDELLIQLRDELLNEECVKEFFYYKNLLDKDDSLKELDEQVRFHQKEMCRNKNDNEKYFKHKTIYEELKRKFDNNPILINYQIAKEEVQSLLVDIKNILS